MVFGLILCVFINLMAGSALAIENTCYVLNNNDNTDLSEGEFLKETSKYLGIPYRSGGSTRKGTDCSGLILQIYSDLFSLDLPHNAAAQKRFIKKVPQEDLKAGDLVFFGARNGRINHIGAYLSDGRFIHASRTSGVTISSLSDPYWRKRFVCSGRIPGLEIADDGKYLDDNGKDEPDEGTFQWSLSKLDSTSNVGLSSGITMDSFVKIKMETFLLMQDLQPLRSNAFNPDALEKNIGQSGQFSLRRGIRFSTDWAPFSWLQVAPYWTYIIERDRVENQTTDTQHLGLSAEIAHPSLRWSFSVAAQPSPYYSLQTEHPSLWKTDWHEMDLFFGCRYRISDTWKLSLFGSGRVGNEETPDTLYLSSRELSWLPSGVEQVSVRLDFSF